MTLHLDRWLQFTDKSTMRFAQVPQRSGGPWGPQGPHEPPRAFLGPLGPQGPLQGHRGTPGEPPEPPRGSGSIFGKTRIWTSRRPPGLRGGSGLAAAFSGLAAAPRGLAASSSGHSRRRPRRILRHGRILRGLAADFERPGGRRRPGGGPKLLFEVLVVCLRRFFPGKKRVFREKSDMYLEKRGAPGRLSRPRDPSRSTRAVILRRGMFRGSQTAD